jgi:prolyl-tRNA editing enzyme YbaK/EbsC (Cys-tRNA(Pro) deacylase)
LKNDVGPSSRVGQNAPALDFPELLATATAAALTAGPHEDVLVAEIDPGLADTQAFCARYDISEHDGANCVIVEARRGDRVWYAACLVLGDERLDVNSAVRKHLEAKKASFAPMDTEIELTGMEYGGINPIGLPPEWPILVDDAIAQQPQLIIGSGLRRSKLLVSGAFLASLPHATVLTIAKRRPSAPGRRRQTLEPNRAHEA